MQPAPTHDVLPADRVNTGLRASAQQADCGINVVQITHLWRTGRAFQPLRQLAIPLRCGLQVRPQRMPIGVAFFETELMLGKSNQAFDEGRTKFARSPINPCACSRSQASAGEE